MKQNEYKSIFYNEKAMTKSDIPEYPFIAGRIVKNEYKGIILLLVNSIKGHRVRITTELLIDVLLNFKEFERIILKEEYKTDETWRIKTVSNIMQYPGKTLALIKGYGEKATLDIYDGSIFEGMLATSGKNGMITVNEFAELNNKTLGHVRKCCSKGLILGARKINGVWFIPEGAEWPGDGRCINGRKSKTVNI